MDKGTVLMVPDEEGSEMIKGRKRVLAWVTAVMMCLTLIGAMPVTVSAQPDTKAAASEHKVQNGTEVTAKEKRTAIKTMESSGSSAKSLEDGSGSSTVTVYFSLSNDGRFVTGNDDDETLMCHVPMTVEYFDLKDYGLEDFYRYKSRPSEEGGGYVDSEVIKQPTLLHLYIKMIETYYLGGEKLDLSKNSEGFWDGGEALTLTGSATSMYMKKFWGHDENLMYYVDHKYPLQAEGWGATADYILLEDNMEIDVAMFTDWAFYTDGAFASFSPTMKKVGAGEAVTLKMTGSSTNGDISGEASSGDGSLVMKNEEIVYAKKDDTYGGNSNDNWEKWDKKTDSSGNVTISFDEPGTYFVSSTPLYETFSSQSGDPCVAPPVAVIEVTGEEQEDDTGTENLTVLSDMYFTDSASASSEKYTMTPDFSAGTGTYTVYVPDNKDTVSIWVRKTDAVKKVIAKSRLKLDYTDRSGSSRSKTNVISESSGQAVQALISKNEKDASCKVTASCGKSSQEYTVNIKRIPTLKSLSLKNSSGEAVSMSPEFSSSVYEYSADVSEDEKELIIAAVASSDRYAVEASGASKDDSGMFRAVLGDDAQKITITVTGTNKEKTQYTLNLVKKAGVNCTFTDLLRDTVVCVTDKDGNDIFKGSADSDGSSLKAEKLREDSEYRYSITKKGYVSKSGTLTAGSNDCEINGSLTEAEKNNSINASIKSLWPDFRGNADNNGVTSAKIPVKSSDTQLLWAVKNGSGWSGSPSSPIIVDDDIVFSTNREIVRVDRITGEVKNRGTMAYKSTFSITPPTYAEGMIFVALADGMIQAFNADTLESLWIYRDPQKGQPNSPITYSNGYIYTGFWNSAVRNADYVCLSVTDEDPDRTDEEKAATWTYSHKGGFYWAGACASDKAVIVGSDDGSDDTASGTLYAFDPQTGKVLDKISDVSGDIRSTVVYDTTTQRYCFTSSAGVFYTVKLGSDGTFDNSSLTKLQLHPTDENGNPDSSASGQSSSTPVVHNGRAYVGVAKAGKALTAYAGHNITVIDLDANKAAYCVPTRGYPQASGLLTSAYESSDGYSYVYFIENYTPGIVRVIKDKAGQTEAVTDRVHNGGIIGEDKEDVNYADTLFTPRGEQAEYAICSPVADEYGTIYFRNDSSYMMALGSRVEKIEITKQPDKTSYDSGETFDPTGMEVTATLANGKERDVTKYISYPQYEASEEGVSLKYSSEPPEITDDILEVAVAFDHVMYNDKEKKSDIPEAYFPVNSIDEDDRVAVRNTSKLIDAIADEEDYAAKKAAAEKARASYEELGEKLQQYVQNKESLVKAENEIADTELRTGTQEPVINVSQSDYKEHKLSWNINSKADGYEIYRSQKAGDRGGVVATVKDRKKLSVTVGTTPGTTYYYTVRPYILVDGSPAGNLYSEQVSGKTTLNAPSLKASSASYSSVKLTWNKVQGAQGYKVYRYSSSKKKYELIKTITRSDTLTYTNTGRTTGTTYYYKISAIRGSAEGDLSGKASAAPKLSVPTSFKAKAGKKSAAVSWKKVSGANGYVVYRSTKSKSGFKAVKTITKGSTVKYTNKSLKKGKTYYYKVRAYRTVNKKKVYSSYTKVLKAKAK